MSAKLRVGAIIIALVMICGLEYLVIRPSVDPLPLQSLPLIVVAWMLFAAAAWLLRGVSLRWSVTLIIIGGIVIQVVAMSVPPHLSDDLYRYMWDGRVQAAGIDPYAYVPSAPQLAHLRDPFLWTAARASSPYPHCVWPGTSLPGHLATKLAAGCTRINRPTVPTIYPPVAEAYFLALHYVTPVHAGSTPVQAAAGACAVLVTLVLLAGLRWLGRDLRWAALWAWCPTVALEAGNSAHVDVVAVLLTAVALLVLARRSGGTRGALLGGALLGLAIATKVTPVLAGPAVLRRKWWAVIVSAAGAVAAVYLPHVLAVGSKVIGFLPGYLQQEGYDSGQRFAIIALFASGRLAIVIAVAILGVSGLAVLRFSDPDRPWHGAVVMTGVALAVTTPKYQWYAILLVMLVVLDGRPEWLAFAAGGYLAAESHLGRWRVIPHSQAVGYGLAALFVALVWVVRLVIARYPRVGFADASTGADLGLNARPAGADLNARPDGADLNARPDGADLNARPAGADLNARPDGADLNARPDGAADADGPIGAVVGEPPDGTGQHGPADRELANLELADRELADRELADRELADRELAGAAAPAGAMAASGAAQTGRNLTAPAVLPPRRKLRPATTTGDERVVNTPKLHEIIPAVPRE